MKKLNEDRPLTQMAMRRRDVFLAHPRQRERMTLGLTTIGYCVYGTVGGAVFGFIAFWM